MRPRWFGIGLALCLISSAAGWGVWKRQEDARQHALLADARKEMAQGRYALARTALIELLGRRPRWDEATYELGLCEAARKRPLAAIELWAQIPETSPLSGWAQVRRSKIEMDRGRWVECETLLRSAAGRLGTHRAEARWGLVLLLRLEGRFDEAKRWLEDGFDVMTDPVLTLQRLYKLDADPFPTEGVAQALDRAGRQAPDDDRVWLGRAHLATRLGHFDEAKSWLDRCLARRPDDAVLWRMRLDWALAADRPAELRVALAHLPAGVEPEHRVWALRAWVAERQGDSVRKLEAVRRQLAANPADAIALERSAELERETGNATAAEALRRRKNELDEARTNYARLISVTHPLEHAAELAELARRLGRAFDARHWAALGSQAGTAGPLETPVPARSPELFSSPGATLADLLPELGQTGAAVTAAGDENKTAVLRFSDDAETAELKFVHENGAGAKNRLIPPITSSGGVGLLDFDNDGWLDVYVVQGGPFPPDSPVSRPGAGDRLYRNRGDGTFEDVTARSGIAAMARGYGHGVAIGDIDNNGYADLFVTRWRSYALYRNRGDGTFQDVTVKAGFAGDRDWPTSAAFADLDSDGDLDLYVCHYMKWNEGENRVCSDPADPTVYHCSPLDFEALSDHVFRNDGGKFVDVTAEAGITDRSGRGFGVVAADLDQDGWIDLFVANDMSPNYLFKNRGGFRFEEMGLASGVAGNASGGSQAGMGVACADLDGDGLLDLAVTNFYNESTTFFRNLGHSLFADRTTAVSLAAPTRYLLGFGIAFLDADNDGWLDLMTANGHIHDGRPQYPWKMPVQLLRNQGGANPHLTDISAAAGAPFQVLRMGRGLAAGDLDNDGRIDALVVAQNEPLAFFHNQSRADHFLTLRLEGITSNRDAVGARVTVECAGRARVAQRTGGGSFQSAGDPRLHFGLGTSTSVACVEVRWPSGRVDRYPELKAGVGYLLREGQQAASPLPGWKHRR